MCSYVYYTLKVHRCLGYCPQFDALVENMTGRETLTLYARLRGVKEKEIRRVVNDLLDAVTLKEYANKLCGTYRWDFKLYYVTFTCISILVHIQFYSFSTNTVTANFRI